MPTEKHRVSRSMPELMARNWVGVGVGVVFGSPFVMPAKLLSGCVKGCLPETPVLAIALTGLFRTTGLLQIMRPAALNFFLVQY